MNSKVKNNNYMQKESSVNNIYLVMKKINKTVNIDEKLKKRTRNGGFIAWPKTMDHQNLQESSSNA